MPNDMKYISVIRPKGKPPTYRFTYSRIKIVKNYKSLPSAQAARDAVLDNFQRLSDHLELFSHTKHLKSRLHREDWEKVKHLKLHGLVHKALAPDDEISNGADIVLNFERPTVGGLMAHYIKVTEAKRQRKAVVRPYSNIKLERRYYYWRDESPLRFDYMTDLAVSDFADEAEALRKTGMIDSTAHAYLKSFSAAHKLVTGESFLPTEAKDDEEYFTSGDGNIYKTGATTQPFTQDTVTQIKAIMLEADADAREMNKDPKCWKTAFEHLYPLVVLFSETAIRKVDVSTLKANEVIDLEDDEINQRTVPYIRKFTKGAKLSTISLTPEAAKVLREQKQYVRDGFYFPAPIADGPALSWDQRYTRLLKKNGLYFGKPYKPLHSFRAYVATRMLEDGASYEDIMGTLNIGLVTVSRYAHMTLKARERGTAIRAKWAETDERERMMRHNESGVSK